MTAVADFNAFAAVLDGRDMIDTACPWCGPHRQAPSNQRRKVLRLWAAPGFISFHCARCGERGYVRDGERHRVNPKVLARHHAATAERERIESERRRNMARWLWDQRRPIHRTPAERYLRQARGIGCRLPTTLGFLPPHGEFPPALIAAFGMAIKPEPGVLEIADAAVIGVHITRLTPDGSAKAAETEDNPNKITIGRSIGTPIVLAPMNDLLGLAITEGIEDALSVHAATGLGAWAAGSASRLPALADAVPDYCDCVSVFADADPDGQRYAAELAARLNDRGIDAEFIPSSGTPA